MHNPDISKIQLLLNQLNIDGWLLYDFRGSNELALGLLNVPPEKISSRRFFYFIPKQGEPVKIVNAIEASNLDHLPGTKLVYASYESLDDALAKTLRPVKNVAMEYSPNNDIPYLSKIDAGSIEKIRSLGVEIKSSADLITLFTAVWTEEQFQDNIPVAKGLTCIVNDACNLINNNVLNGIPSNEYQVQQFIMKQIEIENKWIAGHPPIVAVNENSANPHYAPDSAVHREINKGDFILIDLWARVDKPDGVWSDITWVGYVGNSVPQRYIDVFNIVSEARDAAFELVKERFARNDEIRGYEVDNASRKVITEAGYGDYFIHRTGHSITTEGHGSGAHMDNFETRDSRLILPGNSFSIEPGIYLPGKFGIRSEIDVFVYPDGKVISTGEVQREIIAILK